MTTKETFTTSIEENGIKSETATALRITERHLLYADYTASGRGIRSLVL